MITKVNLQHILKLTLGPEMTLVSDADASYPRVQMDDTLDMESYPENNDHYSSRPPRDSREQSGPQRSSFNPQTTKDPSTIYPENPFLNTLANREPHRTGGRRNEEEQGGEVVKIPYGKDGFILIKEEPADIDVRAPTPPGE